jgi:hypothetical protein
MRKMSHRFSLLIISALAAGSVLAAGSTRYKWRDAEGNLHYTDSLPADAGKRGYDVINAQGILVKRVQPAKSAEELAAAHAEAAKAKAGKDEADRHAREDQQLLAANPTETDLKSSQQQQLEMIDQNINSARIGLQSQERSLADLLGRAAEFERNEKPLPAKLTTQIGELRKQIEAQHALIDRRASERETAKASFDAELERYRRISAQTRR